MTVHALHIFCVSLVVVDALFTLALLLQQILNLPGDASALYRLYIKSKWWIFPLFAFTYFFGEYPSALAAITALKEHLVMIALANAIMSGVDLLVLLYQYLFTTKSSTHAQQIAMLKSLTLWSMAFTVIAFVLQSLLTMNSY